MASKTKVKKKKKAKKQLSMSEMMEKYLSKYCKASRRHEERLVERDKFLKSGLNEAVLSKTLKTEIDFNKILEYLKNSHDTEGKFLQSTTNVINGDDYNSIYYMWLDARSYIGHDAGLKLADYAFEYTLTLALQGLTKKLTKEDIKAMVYTSPAIISIIPEKYLDEELKTIAIECTPNLISKIENSSARLQQFVMDYYSNYSAHAEQRDAFEMIKNPKKSVFLRYCKKLIKEYKRFDLHMIDPKQGMNEWSYSNNRYQFKHSFETVLKATAYSDTSEYLTIKSDLQDIEAIEASEKLLEEVK